MDKGGATRLSRKGFILKTIALFILARKGVKIVKATIRHSPDIPYNHDPYGKLGWRLKHSRLIGYNNTDYIIETHKTLAELFEDIQYLRAFCKHRRGLHNRRVVQVIIEVEHDDDITGSD